MPYVYILRCSDGTFYTGHSTDLDSRLKAHNDGVAANYTARRRPVELVYSELARTEIAAVQRERQLKRWSAAKKEARRGRPAAPQVVECTSQVAEPYVAERAQRVEGAP